MKSITYVSKLLVFSSHATNRLFANFSCNGLWDSEWHQHPLVCNLSLQTVFGDRTTSFTLVKQFAVRWELHLSKSRPIFYRSFPSYYPVVSNKIKKCCRSSKLWSCVYIQLKDFLILWYSVALLVFQSQKVFSQHTWGEKHSWMFPGHISTCTSFMS